MSMESPEEEQPLTLRCACQGLLTVSRKLARRSPQLEPLCDMEHATPVPVQFRKSAVRDALRTLDPDFGGSDDDSEEGPALVAAVACAAAARSLFDAETAKAAATGMRVAANALWRGPALRAAAEAQVLDAPAHVVRLAAAPELPDLLKACTGCEDDARPAKRARAADAAPLFEPSLLTRALEAEEVLLPHLRKAPGAATMLAAAQDGALRSSVVAKRVADAAAAARAEATLALARALAASVRTKNVREGAVRTALASRTTLEARILREAAAISPQAAAACASGTLLRLAAFFDAVERAKAPWALVTEALGAARIMLPEAADTLAFREGCGCGNRARAAEWRVSGSSIVWLREGDAAAEDADLARVLALVDRERLSRRVGTLQLTCFNCLGEIRRRELTANWALTKARW